MKKQICRFALLGCCLFIASIASGCAFGDRVVALRYVPDAKADHATVSGKEIYVGSFKDATSNKIKKQGKEIGEVRNGYNIKTASVVSKSTDLGPWITQGLSDELKRCGFNVINTTSLPPGIKLGIDGSIKKCYSKMYFFKGAVSTVQATINIQKNGVVVSSKEYVGETKGAGGLLGAKGYEDAFNRAIADLLNKVIADVVEASK